jgi:hypothetical protein
MQRAVSFSLVFFLLVLTAPAALAAEHKGPSNPWMQLCASCHNGARAVEVEQIRRRYRTLSAFAQAVKVKDGNCLAIMRDDDALMRRVASGMNLEE